MGGFLGGLLGTGTNKWIEGGMGTVLANEANASNGALQSLYGGLWPAITNVAGYNLQNQIAPALMNQLYGQGSVQNQLGGFLGGLGNTAGGYFGGANPYNNAMTSAGTQGLGSAGDSLLNYAGNVNNTYGGQLAGLGNTGNLAGQVFSGGGWTPQYQQGFEGLSNFLNQGTPGLQSSAGTANNLIGNVGSNPFNQALQNNALSVEGTGGMTPLLGGIVNPLMGTIGAQGNNAQSNALMGGASPLLQSFGQTNLTQGLANQGMKLFNQQALMNPAQAEGLARNAAATSDAQQAQHAEQQALARGGGPGAVVANGMQNQGMADFANQSAQNEAQAATNALQNQQQLQLQQQLGGGNLASGAGNLQNSLLGTAGGLAQGSGSLANNLYMQATGMIPTTQNAAVNNLNAYLGGAGTGSQNQLGMLGQGGNVAQMLESGQLGGLNAMTGMMGAENNYALGAGGLQNSIGNNLGTLGLGSLTNAGNLYNNVFSQGLGQGQLGLGQFNALTGAQLGGYGALNNTTSNLNNAYSNAINPLLGVGGQMTNIGTAGLGGQAGLFGGMGGALASGGQLQQGAFGGLLNAFLNG